MKVGLLITARMKSSRLPFKLLMDLNGYSIVEHVIERAKLVKGLDNIILCTSVNKQDKPLVEVSQDKGIFYFLGSEEDVLVRLLSAANFFGLDYIINITGENPLFSIDHANQYVDLFNKDAPDFIYSDELPIGCAVYGIKTKALQTVCEFKKEIDTEIWGPLINRPEIFDVRKIPIQPYYHRAGLRLTNDYIEDYHLMCAIFRHFPPKSTPSLHEALHILDTFPEYYKINGEKKQAALDPETSARIDRFYKDNASRILKIKEQIYHDFR